MTKSSTCFLKVTRKLFQVRWYEKYCEKEVLNFTDLHKKKIRSIFTSIYLCTMADCILNSHKYWIRKNMSHLENAFAFYLIIALV